MTLGQRLFASLGLVCRVCRALSAPSFCEMSAGCGRSGGLPGLGQSRRGWGVPETAERRWERERSWLLMICRAWKHTRALASRDLNISGGWGSAAPGRTPYIFYKRHNNSHKHQNWSRVEPSNTSTMGRFWIQKVQKGKHWVEFKCVNAVTYEQIYIWFGNSVNRLIL